MNAYRLNEWLGFTFPSFGMPPTILKGLHRARGVGETHFYKINNIQKERQKREK
jgi:hypothetical protein